MRIEASEAAKLNMSLSFDSPFEHNVTAKKNQLHVAVRNVGHEGVPASLTAQCVIRVMADGKTVAGKNTLDVSGATAATIIVSAATNFVNYHDVSGNALKKAESYLRAAAGKTYAELLDRHTTAYKRQYARVSLTLPEGKTLHWRPTSAWSDSQKEETTRLSWPSCSSTDVISSYHPHSPAASLPTSREYGTTR